MLSTGSYLHRQRSEWVNQGLFHSFPFSVARMECRGFLRIIVGHNRKSLPILQMDLHLAKKMGLPRM